MQKIKRYRTADCVIGGFATGKTFNPIAGLSARCCSDFVVPMACSITVDFLQASRPKISRLLRINSSPQGRILKALQEMLRPSEPMVHEAIIGMAISQVEIRGRSILRSFYERAFPAWDVHFEVAAR